MNNKGFAISSVMYIILILGVFLFTVTLYLLSSRNSLLTKIKSDVSNNLNNVEFYLNNA